MILLVTMVTSLTISVLNEFHLFDLAASSEVTIKPADREGDESMDEVNAGTESTETQKAQHRETIQPASNPIKSDTNDQNHDGDYQIDIPDGAAWKETVSERFYPSELNVPTGSDVTWTNEDDVTHTVTSGTNAGYGLYEFLQDGMFNSGELEEGESFTFHFAEPGTYEYFCVPHPWMSGVVTVQ
jgi:plastocyanin